MKVEGPLALLAALAVAVTGCDRLALPGSGPDADVLASPGDRAADRAADLASNLALGATPPLRGRIEPTALAPVRSAQATVPEIASGATVALIDTTSGNTVASVVSDDGGGFDLAFPGSFVPKAGQSFYLEAIKGLAVGGAANRAGAAIARVRTLVVFASGAWSSLTGSSIVISRATTATAILAAYRSLSATQLSRLLGTVSGPAFDPAGTALAADDFDRVLALVAEALVADQDPVETIAFDGAGATAAARFARKAGLLAVFDGFSPAIVPRGGTATFKGQNFPNPGSLSVRITIGGTPVATWSVDPGRTQLTVTLAGGTFGGYFEILQGGSRVLGPFVPVAGTTGTLVGPVPGYQDGRGPNARVNEPLDIALDAAGNLFVADSRNNRIRKITPAGDARTFAGTGAAGATDGAATSATFSYPNAVDIDPAGNLVVLGGGNYTIRKIAQNGTVSTFAGTGTQGSVDGAAGTAQFNNPAGLAVDSAGNIYTGGDDVKIRKTTPAGVTSTIANLGGYPYGIVVDGTSNIWATDRTAGTLKKITQAGVVTTLASTLTFVWPSGLAIDAAGQMYVADTQNYRIVKCNPATGACSILAGAGTQGYLDGLNATARFNQNAGWNDGLVVAPSGLVYVADKYNSAIRVIAP